MLQGEGTITDGYEPYMENMRCSWTIVPPRPGTIFLTFTNIALEAGFDYVKVYDGSDANAPLVATITDHGPQGQVILAERGAGMFIEFTSDGSVNADGFDATFSTRETPAPTNLPSAVATPSPTSGEKGGACGLSLVEGTDSGTITDGSGILMYENNLRCDFTLYAMAATSTVNTARSYYRLDFSEFSLETNYDWIYIYSGSLEDSTDVKDLSDDSIMPSVVSTYGKTNGKTLHFMAERVIYSGTGTFDGPKAEAIKQCMAVYDNEYCRVRSTDDKAFNDCLADNIAQEAARRKECMRKAGAIPPLLEIASPAVHITFVSDMTVPDTGFAFDWKYVVNQTKTKTESYRRSEEALRTNADESSSSGVPTLTAVAAVGGILAIGLGVLVAVYRWRSALPVTSPPTHAAESMVEEARVDWM